MTVALYPHHYDITGPKPLGNARGITAAQQAAEYRAAYAALRRAQSIGEPFDGTPPPRDVRRIDVARRL
jgi:hypothetical protein